jgi:serine/threonine protein kinase
VSSSDPLINRTLAGRYRLERLIGQGGMGRVYQALHLTMGKRVALKLLAPELADDPENVDRFEREAAASARLRHPNTIQIFDYGRAEDGQLYLAMELLSGRDLAECIAQEGALSPARAVHIFTQILKSLKEAHANGIIHRDLKPENIFLTDIPGEFDFVKVLDFGIAKFTHSDRIKQTLTVRGFVCGTPMYVAPEQALGMPVTAATDLYSAGVILYEMLTGEPPFTGDDPVTLAMKQIHAPPPKLPDAIRAALPDALEELLYKLLDKAPGRRPKESGEILRKLATLDDLSLDSPGIKATRRALSDTLRAETDPAAARTPDATPHVPAGPQESRPESNPDIVDPRTLQPTLPSQRLRHEEPVPESPRSGLGDFLTVLVVLALIVLATLLWLRPGCTDLSERQPAGSSERSEAPASLPTPLAGVHG